MKFEADSVLDFDQDIIVKAIRAIEKAVSEDIPRQFHENCLETNNYLAFIRGDYINTNLRELLNSSLGELLAFQRFGWRGRLLVDRDHHLTYSITTQATLNQISHKQRKQPHFLQTLLFVENHDLEGHGHQMTLFDVDQFDVDTYCKDFRDITNSSIEDYAGYRHCVIVYRANQDIVTDIKLVLLDPQFAVVEEYDLNEFRRPDFSLLTSSTTAEANIKKEAHNTATRNLTKLKKGIKPGLKEVAKKA